MSDTKSDEKAVSPNPEAGQTDGEKQEDGGGVKLKANVTLANGITIIVGSMIGSGIFISPTGILVQVGSVGLSLIVWFLCGVYSAIGAYCFAELGTLIVSSGADYTYIYEAFGPFFAFLRLWVECLVIRPCTIAIVSLAFAKYVIEPLFPTCDQPSSAVTLLAVLCISKSLRI
jgi:L-type amino acid transporter 8